MFKRLMLAVIAGSAIMAAASCGSGGGNVTANNPLNPTTAPSGFVPSTSPSPISSATTPSTVPVTATPTSGATTTPSPSPTPTEPGMVSASPTATATSSGGSTLATTCATATGAPSTMMYTLPGTAETIQIPNYPAAPPYQITGSSMLPTQTAGSVMTIEISQNSFTNGGSFPAPSGTVDFYTTLEFSKSTSFGSGNSTTLKIPVTIVSPCVVANRAYTVEESAGGIDDLYSEVDTPTANGSVTGHLETALNPVPANTVVYITVSH